MPEVAQGLWVRLGLDSAQFKAGLADAKAGLVSWRNETNESNKSILSWGAAIGGTIAPLVAAGYAVYATTEKFGGMAQQLNDLSYQTGISTDYLQKLEYAAVLSGDSFGTVSFGMNKLTLQMGEFANGSDAAREAFGLIGVTPTGKGVDKVFEEISRSITDIEDPTKRMAAAMAIFGRNGKEMLPFMEDYIKNLEKIKGFSGLTDQELEDNAKAKQDLDDLGKRWETLEGRMVSYFSRLHSEGQKLESASYIDNFFFPSSKASGAGGRKGEAGLAESPVVKEQIKLTDKYSGLSEAGLKYQLAVDEIADAELEYNAALEGTQETLDIAGLKLRQAELAFQSLRIEMYENATATTALQKAQADLNDEIERGKDIDKNYIRELSLVGTDVAAARELTIRHNWAKADQQTEINKATASVANAPAGDLYVNIDGKTVASVPGVISPTAGSSLIQKGVRT